MNELIKDGNTRKVDGVQSDILVQLVVFTLDNEEYAVPITDLQEIIKVPEVTPIPNAPAFIKGILNLRGKIVVVIDLERRFKLIRDKVVELKHIIITEVNDTSFGIVVDEVMEVLTVPSSTIQLTPTLVSTKIHTDYLKGVVVIKNTKKAEEEKKVEKAKPAEIKNLVSPAKIVSDAETVEVNMMEEKPKQPEVNNKQTVEQSDSRLLILIDLSKILQEKELIEASETADRGEILSVSNGGTP